MKTQHVIRAVSLIVGVCIFGSSANAITPVPSPTYTFTPTKIPTPIMSATFTPTHFQTPTKTPTYTPTRFQTPTKTPASSQTATLTPTVTPTATTPTPTPTRTPSSDGDGAQEFTFNCSLAYVVNDGTATTLRDRTCRAGVYYGTSSLPKAQTLIASCIVEAGKTSCTKLISPLAEGLSNPAWIFSSISGYT